MKAKLGPQGTAGAAAGTVPFGSKASGAAGGPPAPQVMRDWPYEIHQFLNGRMPEAFRKFDKVMEEAAILINGDLSPAEYARHSNGGKTLGKLLEDVKNAEKDAEELLKAGKTLKDETRAAEGLHRGWSVSENLKNEALEQITEKLDALKKTRAALEAIDAGGPGGGGAAGLAGRTAAKGIAEGAEGLAKGAESLRLAGGARALLGALGEIGLPILDALILEIDALGAAAAAKDSIKDRNAEDGFATGLAAGLLEESPDWVREKLGFHSASADVKDIFLGAEGVAEKSFNKGLSAGYTFARGLSNDQKAAWRDAAFKALAAQGYHVSDNELFGESNVGKLAGALIPIIREMVQQERNAAAAKADMERRMRIDHYGHNM